MDERNRELVKDDHGPWGPRSGEAPTAAMPDPERPVAGARAFNAPWPVLLLVAALGAAFAAQGLLLTQTVGGRTDLNEAGQQLILTAQALREGRWYVLESYQFLHGGWLHFGLNSIYALAFAAPVVRFLGANLRGALIFFAFYSVCGVLAGLGFVATHWGGQAGAIGASGAIAGLMGAAARLMDRPGELSPIMTRSVYSLGGSWVAINLVMAVSGAALTLGGAVVAWEAHIVGFVAGVLLIGPFARVAGK
jgi:membrane associated rhomboid family serine protease